MDNSSEFAEFLGRYLLANPKSSLTPWFPTVIAVIAKNNRNLAIEFIKNGIEKNDNTLTRCVTLALSRSLYSFPVVDEEIEVIKQLAHYKDPWVRHTIVRSVKRFSIEKKYIALHILLSIDFSCSKEIADEVLGEFEEKNGTFKTEDLSNNQLQQLLASLVKCPSIDDYNICLFLRKTSFSHPGLTIKLLMDRVKYKETNQKLKDYDPLPFLWEKSVSLRFYETAQYEDILRTVRNWVAEKTDNWISFHYRSNLFKLISAGFDRVTLKVLEEWVISSDQLELETAASLLSEAERTFIWDNQQYVINILERAQKFGSTCYKKVFSSLYASVIQGGRSRTPGQPFPENVEQRNRSQEIMLTLPVGSPAYKFYKTLYENAIANIARDTLEDSELE